MCVCVTYGNFKQLNIWRMFFIHRWQKKALFFSYNTFPAFGAKDLKGSSQIHSLPLKTWVYVWRFASAKRWAKTWLFQTTHWLHRSRGTGYFNGLYEKVQFVTFASDGPTCVRQPKEQNVSVEPNTPLDIYLVPSATALPWGLWDHRVRVETGSWWKILCPSLQWI